MNWFIYEITDNIGTIIYRISNTVINELCPRIKIGILYPFAKLGIVSAQLYIANILHEHYWYWGPKNSEKWVEKGVCQNNPFAIILKGHFCRYKARQIEDEESPASNKAADEFLKNLENPEYKSDLSYEIESNRIWEEKERRTIPLFFEALDCYKKAAEMNNSQGQFYLFSMYEYYRYRLNLKPTGTKYLKLAAENGLPNAQYIFAEKCLEHDNLKNGIYWMKKAANSRKRDWVINEGYFADRKKAREWYKKNKDILEIKKKAFSGDPKALYDYSEFFMHGSHKRDALHLAHEWHTKAAKAGYPKAMGEEGSFIIHGWAPGTLKDAFEYYVKAYENGYKMASWGLGDCYYYGWGTERSLEKARYYYKIAKRLGVGINMKALKKMTDEEFLKVDCNKVLNRDRDFYN